MTQIKNFLQKIKAVLAAWVESIQIARMKQAEYYLSQSTDLYDLEARQRKLDDYMAGRRHYL